MSNLRNVLGRNCIVFVSTIVIGFVLLVLAYLLPTAPMQEHLSAELDALESRYLVQPFPTRPNADLDFMTDYHMLAIAANQGSSDPIHNAMRASYKLPAPPVDQISILKVTLSPTEENPDVAYARYWHGYLVPLKLQLLFADYYSILLYNGIVLLALLVLVCVLMSRRGLDRYIPALILAVGLISPVSISMSMQYYACAYITLIAMATILAFHERLRNKSRYDTVFLLIGMLTSYLDFLTAPIVTLGLPLVLLGLLLAQRGELSWRKVILLPLHWTIGFAGMWVAKWLIGTLILNYDVVAEALTQVTARTSSQVGHSPDAMFEHLSYLSVVNSCWDCITGPISSKLCIALYALASMVVFVRSAITKHVSWKSGVPVVVFLLLVALLPFIWTRALLNHTYMHAYFTFRMYVVTMFAVGCIPFAFALRTSAGSQEGRHFAADKNNPSQSALE